MVRVAPDVSGVDRVFDYEVPAGWEVQPGDMVRVPLGPRRVTGWVLDIPDQITAATLKPLGAVVSAGPAPELVDLARWASWRWAGKLTAPLKTASPHRRVPIGFRPDPPSGGGHRVVVHRTPPALDRVALIASLCAAGPTIVVVATVAEAGHLLGRLRASGLAARPAEDWAGARRAAVVVGARSAVWATVSGLHTIVVVDEHSETLFEERSPTWHARDVAIERGRRADVAVHLLSPVPTPEALAAATAVDVPSRSEERRGWPVTELIDRRKDEPPGYGLFSPRLAAALSATDGPILAVLNQKGRARLLACATCRELVRTEDGEHLMVEDEGGLVAVTGERRPMVCAYCGGTSLKRLKLGVDRATEELAALTGETVAAVTADGPLHDARISLGTEAVLHRRIKADLVAFLDLDQELLAPRVRAPHQAMVLLARAARIVGGRRPGSRIVVQTRMPDHRVLLAVTRADPQSFDEAEVELRRAVGWPPFGALAQLSGGGAAEVAAAAKSVAERVEGFGPDAKGRFLLRAPSADVLADALAAVRTERTAHRTRVVVDPPRA